jgi:hypothetical protein
MEELATKEIKVICYLPHDLCRSYRGGLLNNSLIYQKEGGEIKKSLKISFCKYCDESESDYFTDPKFTCSSCKMDDYYFDEEESTSCSCYKLKKGVKPPPKYYNRIKKYCKKMNFELISNCHCIKV